MKTIIITLFTSLVLINPLNNQLENERIELLNQVFKTLESQIANPEWLKHEDFITFKNHMYSNEILNLNEEDFYIAFDLGRKNLPFSHFQLIKKNKSTSKATKSEQNLPITWKALDNKTAYLKISSFIVSGEPMMQAVQEIGTDKFENLIIDLRGNTGGSLDAPVILGQFLTQNTIDAGYYLTRKWFEKSNSLPTQSQVSKMPLLQDFTYTGIRKMFVNEAAFRTIIPGHNRPIYQGKVYILIDYNTASACEPLIDLVQKTNIATLVGETSNGAMLSGHTFPVNDDYSVFVPIADYYTSDGKKIDKIGVKPDIEVHPKRAMEYVLNIINQE
ncbi:S41 family peptidase [Hanstruepera flava]|uniref:S41 family peptidase n=1 Tax=Hanstruepera flava TaxID=2930218 RepID=UPI0020296183|nr:S41 family peptidase [Hanstruepera flava]